MLLGCVFIGVGSMKGKLPYPLSNTMGAEPPVSAPMYLGRFDFPR